MTEIEKPTGVFAYLDCSTVHVSKKTMDLLDEGSKTGMAMTIAPYEYGAFVSVPQFINNDAFDGNPIPDDLLEVLKFARYCGCDIVRFDADGESHEELPTYDWDAEIATTGLAQHGEVEVAQVKVDIGNAEVSMLNVAVRILNDYSGSIKPNGEPIKISKESRLYRFAAFENGEMVGNDKLHILVDGCGGYTAIVDPDTAKAAKRNGNLSEFIPLKTRFSSQKMTVSLDDGITFQAAYHGVYVIIEGLPIPGEDDVGELHIRCTSEGLIMDAWVDRDAHLTHNIGTSSCMYEDYVSALIEENA